MFTTTCPEEKTPKSRSSVLLTFRSFDGVCSVVLLHSAFVMTAINGCGLTHIELRLQCSWAIHVNFMQIARIVLERSRTRVAIRILPWRCFFEKNRVRRLSPRYFTLVHVSHESILSKIKQKRYDAEKVLIYLG